MNWTGGRLQRSKQARKGIAQIQKAHFARARTRLQNGANEMGPSFHTSIDGTKAALGRHATLLGSWPVPDDDSRGTWRPKRVIPQSGRSQHDPQEDGCARSQDGKATEAAYRTRSNRKMDTDQSKATQSEDALLEARRQHLLQQEDWAGLKHQGPGPLLFSPCMERGRIGKRRKIRGRDALAMRQMREAIPSIRRVRNPPHGAFMSGALPPGDIRIRIGTDAWSDLAPTRQTHGAPHEAASSSLDAPSDIMLFDCEDWQAAPSPRPDMPQIGNQSRQRFVGVRPPICAAPPEMRGEALQTRQAADKSEEASCQTRALAAAQNRHVQREGDRGTSVGSVATYEDNKVSRSSISHYPGNTQHALRPVIDRISDCSAVAEERASRASRGFAIGEPNRVHALANAALLQCGNERGDHHAGMVTVAQSPIVDDGLWRSFLSIADNSSNHSSKAHASETNVLRYREQPQLHGLNESMCWSQHAVQDGQTRPNASSCISASLPSLGQGSERDALEKQLHNETVRDTGSGKKRRDNGEQLWRAFVFGVDAVGASAVSSVHAADAAEVRASRASAVPSLPGSTPGTLGPTPFSEHF